MNFYRVHTWPFIKYLCKGDYDRDVLNLGLVDFYWIHTWPGFWLFAATCLPAFLLLSTHPKNVLFLSIFFRISCVICYITYMSVQNSHAFVPGCWDNLTFTRCSIWEFGHVLGHFAARLEAIFILICSGAHTWPFWTKVTCRPALALRFPQGGEGECLISPFPHRILLLCIWDFYIFTFPTVSTFNISGFSGAAKAATTHLSVSARKPSAAFRMRAKRRAAKSANGRNAQLPKLQFARNGDDQQTKSRQHKNTVGLQILVQLLISHFRIVLSDINWLRWLIFAMRTRTKSWAGRHFHFPVINLMHFHFLFLLSFPVLC